MFRLWLLAVAVSIAASPATLAKQRIRGVIVDETGAAIGGASIRLMRAVSEEVAGSTASDSGAFDIGITAAGSYILKVWRQGFRIRKIMVVVGAESEITELGNIRLDVGSCDAPGVMCDYFGVPPPPDHIVSSGRLQVRNNCMLALAPSTVFCPEDPRARRETEADVRIKQDETGVYATALNGAALSEPAPGDYDCRHSSPNAKSMRIDGLGPGDEICIRTHDGRWSHVFLTEFVTRGSREIAIWHITRRR